MKRVRAGALDVAYEEHGAPTGPPVVLLHGFPYDVRAYDGVAPVLAAEGCRVLVPYLRGYGPTRFLSAETPRSGQQGALAHDLLALLDALDLTPDARHSAAGAGVASVSAFTQGTSSQQAAVVAALIAISQLSPTRS